MLTIKSTLRIELFNHIPPNLLFFWGSQKLIIDQKSYYLFGRNKEVCDFSLEHTSCSRVHAALVFHRHLNRSFLIDLKSSKFLGL